MPKKEFEEGIEDIKKALNMIKILIKNRIYRHEEYGRMTEKDPEMKFLKHVLICAEHAKRMLEHVKKEEYAKIQTVRNELTDAIVRLQTAE